MNSSRWPAVGVDGRVCSSLTAAIPAPRGIESVEPSAELMRIQAMRILLRWDSFASLASIASRYFSIHNCSSSGDVMFFGDRLLDRQVRSRGQRKLILLTVATRQSA